MLRELFKCMSVMEFNRENSPVLEIKDILQLDNYTVGSDVSFAAKRHTFKVRSWKLIKFEKNVLIAEAVIAMSNKNIIPANIRETLMFATEYSLNNDIKLQIVVIDSVLYRTDFESKNVLPLIDVSNEGKKITMLTLDSSLLNQDYYIVGI